jgi:hypothetical protein
LVAIKLVSTSSSKSYQIIISWFLHGAAPSSLSHYFHRVQQHNLVGASAREATFWLELKKGTSKPGKKFAIIYHLSLLSPQQQQSAPPLLLVLPSSQCA